MPTAGRMLCAVGTGGLDLLRGLDISQRTSKFLRFLIAYRAINIHFDLAVLRELPTIVRAGAITLNGSHSLGDE